MDAVLDQWGTKVDQQAKSHAGQFEVSLELLLSQMMQTNFSPRNISANKVERVVPNALKDFRCGPSVLRASRSTFHCIVG